jgi:putative ABC transport system permease protein
VAIAYPELAFPVRVRLGSEETRTTLRALPARMREFKPYSKLAFGEFYDDDSSHVAVIGWDTLKRLKLLVQDPKAPVRLDEDDTSEVRTVDADSVLGQPIEVVSVAFDGSQLAAGAMFGLAAFGRMPLGESRTELTIGGIMKGASSFSDMTMTGGVILPLGTAEQIPRLGFSSVWDLLGGGVGPGAYSSIHARCSSIADMESARSEIEKMGLHVFAISDQLKEIRKGFLLMDSILGAIGTIALVVAALGIANTMVMSILERTREIGVMKAIGASETEIKLIFFVEAAAIGVIGAVFGLILGWGVTRVANFVANARILPAGEAAINLFYFPLWLIAGAVGFAILISLLAGLYPAIRAASIDPIEALRHD